MQAWAEGSGADSAAEVFYGFGNSGAGMLQVADPPRLYKACGNPATENGSHLK